MKVIGGGSVTQLEKGPRGKCRKWRLRVQTSRGERSKRFTGTYTQAKTALRGFVGELSTPISDMPFEEFSADWMRRRELSGELQESTLRKYRTDLAALLSEFGDDRLCDLDRRRVEEGLLRIKHSGGKRVSVLSGTYMNQLHTLMKSVMQSAEDDGAIPANPMRRLKAPKADTSKRNALDRGTFARFMAALDALPLDARTVAVRIAVLAGLRRGEIVSLRWGDVGDGLIRVRRSFDEKAGKVKCTKTGSGVRDVPTVGRLEDALAAWKPVQAARLAELGIAQGDDTPVCASEVGTIMRPQNLGRWWAEARGGFGLDGIVLHELRHTYLTMLADFASGKVLKSVAGWSSLAEADTYVHADDDANREAVERLGSVIDFEVAKLRGGGTSAGTSNGTSEPVRVVSHKYPIGL